jgi:hypothetical protein
MHHAERVPETVVRVKHRLAGFPERPVAGNVGRADVRAREARVEELQLVVRDARHVCPECRAEDGVPLVSSSGSDGVEVSAGGDVRNLGLSKVAGLCVPRNVSAIHLYMLLPSPSRHWSMTRRCGARFDARLTAARAHRASGRRRPRYRSLAGAVSLAQPCLRSLAELTRVFQARLVADRSVYKGHSVKHTRRRLCCAVSDRLLEHKTGRLTAQKWTVYGVSCGPNDGK